MANKTKIHIKLKGVHVNKLRVKNRKRMTKKELEKFLRDMPNHMVIHHKKDILGNVLRELERMQAEQKKQLAESGEEKAADSENTLEK